MTPIELAEQLIDDVARAVRSGEWSSRRPLVVTGVASVLVSLEQSGYERGLAEQREGPDIGHRDLRTCEECVGNFPQ